jgi:hypothetical protein
MFQNQQYLDLSFYTLSHKSNDFIHQHIVDAYTAQVADENTKPIAIVYALAGLYLHLEKKYSGKQVQLAHIEMSKMPKLFDPIILPENRGNITVKEVIEKPEGAERDKMIHQWCISVWDAYALEQNKVIAMTAKLLPQFPE